MSAMASSARLAIFMPSFRGGGAERVMVTLAHGFAAQGVRVDILVAQLEGPNVPPAVDGIRIVDLAAPRVLRAMPRLARYLRRESPHAVLSALSHSNVVAVWARALARTPTRIVVSEHIAVSQSTANATRLRERMLPAFMRRAYPRADGIVAVSEGVADDLAAYIGVDRSRITPIYNPIVTERLTALAQEPLNLPGFGSSDPPVVLGAGRLTAQKDFESLVRAFAEVRRRRPARLVILGEGEERRKLQALARELGVEADIHLPGYVDNPYPYMKRAGVFVLCSRWEGFGNVLVEAMACGTPVVSTDCPDGPREILEGGRHGRLVPVADPPALARAIEAQLDAPACPTAVRRAHDFTADAALVKYRKVLEL
jgi:glycosyltransferase involved in cell wall biosynthesis